MFTPASVISCPNVHVQTTALDLMFSQRFMSPSLILALNLIELPKKLSVLLSKFSPHYDFVLVEVNRHKISSLFNYKDRLPTSLRFSLVYYFSCVRCACKYVSSTSRNLHTRVREHEDRSHRTGGPQSNPPSSIVRLHASSCVVSISKSDLKFYFPVSVMVNLYSF